MKVLQTKLAGIVLSLSMILSLALVPALAADTSVHSDGNEASSSATGTKCSIKIQSSEHGHITVSPEEAYLFDTVTLTVFPDDGYRAGLITVTSDSGKNLSLSSTGKNQYSFNLNHTAVTITAFFLPAQIPVERVSFSDVSDSAWYRDAVYYVANKGIMSGTSTDTFEPDDTLTRAMTAQILYAMEGKPNFGSINFGDVTYEDWYCDAVAWANAKQIMTGYEEGRFGPNTSVTREQVALILFNYAKLHNYDTRASSDLSDFSDYDSISTWAKNAMPWAVGVGILSARDGDRLEPGAPATRAEIAQSLMQFCENVAETP